MPTRFVTGLLFSSALLVSGLIFMVQNVRDASHGAGEDYWVVKLMHGRRRRRDVK